MTARAAIHDTQLMTGNQIKGKGFRGALRYNLAKVSKNVAEVLDSTFARNTEQGIMKEVHMIRSLRPTLQKYFYHTSINFPPEENPSSETMKKIGREYLETSGFTQHQYIMFRHFDAGHPHLHILVNRIGYDGQVLSDSNDYQRSEKILRALEIKYGLRQVTPSREAKVRAVTKDELEMMKRTKEPSNKLKLQVIVAQAMKGNPDTRTFIRSLESAGVRVLFNQATTGYVSGISYELNGFKITGAKLGNDFKWSSVRAKIDYDQERDRAVIQDNTRQNSPKTDDHSLYIGDTDSRADLGTILKPLQDLFQPDTSLDSSPEVGLRNLKKCRKKRRRRS
jgi:hypothetical protein